ncbi:MAG: hypothetical protein Q8T08_07870 [Ignavibacteria bacterium]|nr:hypothetical protein [Ignavibacteria bacterium]
MEKLDVKAMIESVISDLFENQPLSIIFLKVQAISFFLGNEQFTEWFKNENYGYEKDKTIPEYRKTSAAVFANVATYGGFWKNYHIPVDQIKDDLVREWLLNINLNDSISELEALLEHTTNEGTFKRHLPGLAYSEIQRILQPGCSVEDAWQEIQRSAIKNVISSVKSKLLQFFLELDMEFKNEINFDVMSEKKVVERIASQTINAGVVNWGSHSTVNANESSIIGGQINSVVINNEMKGEIEKVVSLIKEVAESFEDEKEEVLNELARIITQLDKPAPKTNIITSALQTINGILMGVAGNMATPVVIDGIQKVLKTIGI